MLGFFLLGVVLGGATSSKAALDPRGNLWRGSTAPLIGYSFLNRLNSSSSVASFLS